MAYITRMRTLAWFFLSLHFAICGCWNHLKPNALALMHCTAQCSDGKCENAITCMGQHWNFITKRAIVRERRRRRRRLQTRIDTITFYKWHSSARQTYADRRMQPLASQWTTECAHRTTNPISPAHQQTPSQAVPVSVVTEREIYVDSGECARTPLPPAPPPPHINILSRV